MWGGKTNLFSLVGARVLLTATRLPHAYKNQNHPSLETVKGLSDIECV